MGYKYIFGGKLLRLLTIFEGRGCVIGIETDLSLNLTISLVLCLHNAKTGLFDDLG